MSDLFKDLFITLSFVALSKGTYIYTLLSYLFCTNSLKDYPLLPIYYKFK